MQECRGLSWNLQTFYSRGEGKVLWLFVRSTVMQMRATQHFHRGLLLGMTQKKEKKFGETH